MWAAIRSDLLDFVTTIKEDTAKVIGKATGEDGGEGDDEGAPSLRDKLIKDVKRSFDTYGAPIEDQHSGEFEKYMTRQFSLSSQAADIAQLLDDEPDVSRYYAELVPAQISPELFWARYFFRLLLVSRGGVVSLDEDEEEEVPWETTTATASETAAAAAASSSTAPMPTQASASAGGPPAPGRSYNELLARIAQLEADNLQLRGHVKVLVGRISELEASAAAGAGAGAGVDVAEPLLLPETPTSPAPLVRIGAEPPSSSSSSSSSFSSSAPAPEAFVVIAPTTAAAAAAPAQRLADLAALDEEEDENWS